MAPSLRKTAAAAAVLLLIILTFESSESRWGYCNDHLSGSYKGVCWGSANDADCSDACFNESIDNYSGKCYFFQCWCYSKCDSKIVAPAGSPIRP
ncbi:unnamed protein product [Urochloa decumbens]|uniref:Knottin scorpion toxin-like domain-containing protein n=1 Tax=Urochloa decumbens TaxID=240449 RepID=A0ABC9AU36_9POAL